MLWALININISEMENGKRPIGRSDGSKVLSLFKNRLPKVSVKHFIYEGLGFPLKLIDCPMKKSWGVGN